MQDIFDRSCGLWRSLRPQAAPRIKIRGKCNTGFPDGLQGMGDATAVLRHGPLRLALLQWGGEADFP